MSIEELAARDAAEREQIRRNVIANEERALHHARVSGAQTRNIERHLAALREGRCRWHHADDPDTRCYELVVPGTPFCADHYIASQPAGAS